MTESTSEQRRRDLIRLAGAGAYWTYKAVLYFFSFLGPALVLHRFRASSAIVLLALAILGCGFAGLIFVALLVITKKLLIGPVSAIGLHTIQTKEAQRWFSAAVVNAIAHESPFRSLIVGLSPIASWYYRGMGARMPNSVMIAHGVLIRDPYFLECGENVTLGGGCFIMGHLGQGKEILLGRVIIEEGAVIGARAIISPDVHIGSHSVVAAGAVVARGTTIPDGETWGGVPARKIMSTSRVASSAVESGAESKF